MSSGALVTCILCAAVNWLGVKIGFGSGPATIAKVWALDETWTYGQVNDWVILDADPDKDRAREATALIASDPERAFPLVIALAQQGSIWSMIQTAWCYHKGLGVEANASDSESWYQRAYEAGSDRALLDYARILAARGDVALLAAVYGAGAARNWTPAALRLARLRLRQSTTRETLLEARPVLERAAEQGSPGAQFLLARNMGSGRFGLREVIRGHRLMRKLAMEISSKSEAKTASSALTA
jgi:TPR repeat protein